jgi:hypothetical protein
MALRESVPDSRQSLPDAARRASRRWKIVAAAMCLVVLGSMAALLKSAVDRVRDAAARTDSV